MKVRKLPDPLPKVHQCGCGSQAFHLCADGRVVCLKCRYEITTLRVAAPSEAEGILRELVAMLAEMRQDISDDTDTGSTVSLAAARSVGYYADKVEELVSRVRADNTGNAGDTK